MSLSRCWDPVSLGAATGCFCGWGVGGQYISWDDDDAMVELEKSRLMLRKPDCADFVDMIGQSEE